MPRLVVQESGHYRLVGLEHTAGGRLSGYMYQIEDRHGRLVCHCGLSLTEARMVFAALDQRSPRKVCLLATR